MDMESEVAPDRDADALPNSLVAARLIRNLYVSKRWWQAIASCFLSRKIYVCSDFMVAHDGAVGFIGGSQWYDITNKCVSESVCLGRVDLFTGWLGAVATMETQ